MLSVIFYVIYSLLSIYEIVLFVRAICSWSSYFRESRVYELAFKLTEPVLRPIRDLMFRIDFVRRCPIDLSFLVLVLLLSGAMRVCVYLM